MAEKRLEDRIGVSQIPIRESLRQLAGLGLLVGNQNGDGARVRKYTTEDVRPTASAANGTDVARMEAICRQMALDVENYGSRRWAELDHAFHHALADASHNERIAHVLKCLLIECHYVFFLCTSYRSHRTPTRMEASFLMQRVVDVHTKLLKFI